MVIHKDTKDFLSKVDSIQSRYLQTVVERQNEDSLKVDEEQRDLESTDEFSHHIDSGQGAF